MLGSPQIAEEAAASEGVDFVYIDRQHGIRATPLEEMLRAVAGHDVTPIVRVSSADPARIGRALDAGAEGVIIPMVEDEMTAALVASACRYQPVGTRSWGPIRAAHGLGTDPREVDAQVLCLVMIENRQGLDRLDAILDVPGVDGVYLGPADLGVSLGRPPRSIDLIEDAEVLQAIERVRSACVGRGLIAGITADPGGVRAAGFSMLTVDSDLGMVRRGLAAIAARGDHRQ